MYVTSPLPPLSLPSPLPPLSLPSPSPLPPLSLPSPLPPLSLPSIFMSHPFAFVYTLLLLLIPILGTLHMPGHRQEPTYPEGWMCRCIGRQWPFGYSLLFFSLPPSPPSPPSPPPLLLTSPTATFTIHRKADGTIRLQNVGDASHWLRINQDHHIDGKGVGTLIYLIHSSYISLLFCFVLFCFVLFCFVLFCFVLFCFVLFCFVLFCFVLFCFVLFCFVLLCFDYLLMVVLMKEESGRCS